MKAQQTLVAFLSGYRGESDYRILKGPWTGERVSARYLKREWYEDDYRRNAGRIWRMDKAAYELQVLTTVGMVRSAGARHGEHVPFEIVDEINRLLDPWRLLYPQESCGRLQSGIYTSETGWTSIPCPANLRAAPSPFQIAMGERYGFAPAGLDVSTV